MQKILVVEDDFDIQDILKNHLIDAGYEVAVASDGVMGIAMFDDTIDLVLLDIMLPKIDGYGVCEVIRKRSQVPIIMLTALSDEENQLRGFEQQIDDYIPKPFSPKILLCKIAAILRRRTAENQNQSLLTYKELSMDIDGFYVYHQGNEVVLTSKEFALLRLMLENQEKVFTRQMLLDRLWADDLEVEERIVDSHLNYPTDSMSDRDSYGLTPDTHSFSAWVFQQRTNPFSGMFLYVGVNRIFPSIRFPAQSFNWLVQSDW